MRQYLLDTDISVNYLRDSIATVRKVQTLGVANLYISEITVAELKYGAAKSNRPAHNRQEVNSFCAKFRIVRLNQVFDVFAAEKVRLEKLGLRLDDFDLLIGATAIRYGFILATNNIKHFERMQNLSLESWTT